MFKPLANDVRHPVERFSYRSLVRARPKLALTTNILFSSSRRGRQRIHRDPDLPALAVCIVTSCLRKAATVLLTASKISACWRPSFALHHSNEQPARSGVLLQSEFLNRRDHRVLSFTHRRLTWHRFHLVSRRASSSRRPIA